MKKSIILTLCFLLVSFATFAGKFILIPVTETNNLESLFNNNDLKIHYYNDNYVLATAEVVHYNNAVVLDENAFGDVDSYAIVYCYNDEKDAYLTRVAESANTLFSGDNFLIMKLLSEGFMPAKNDGMVTIRNTEAKLPKSTFDFPVLTEPDDIILGFLDEVSQDGLIANVQHLEDYFTRNCNHANSIAAQNWIQDQFDSFGLSTTTQSAKCHYNGPWWGGTFQAENVIAIQVGTEFPDEYIVTGCHFDSFAWQSPQGEPGADDNATGTAGVIETARILSQYDFKRSIIYCAFTAEECGLDGSKCYAEQCASQGMNIIGYFNIDMSGYLMPGSEIHIDLIHPSFALPLANYYINVADIYFPEIPVVPYPNLPGGDSDHTSFNQNGYMGIFPFEDRINDSPHIHTSNDLIGPSVNKPEQVKIFTQINIAGIATLALFDGAVPLAKPTNCVAQYLEENKIKVTWDAPASSTPNQYGVYRDGTFLAQCEATTTTYIDEVSDFEDYCYKITAMYDGNESLPSNESCAAVPKPFLPPINCVAKYVEDEGIQITWLPNPAVSTFPVKYFVYKDDAQLDETEDPFYTDDVQDNDLHCYKVTAIYVIADEPVESDFSNVDCDSVPFIDHIIEYNSNYKIYPNPTNGELTITNYELGITNVEVYDVYGRNITCNVSHVTCHENKVDVSHLSAGIYFIKIGNEFIGKFIKE